ncbi:hypothetical protein L6452_09488 [Arctium lappa]|uniref:Uncharacterized protein n=1 Tax=Arctium lappa TaxID=4217 RepID=A0ACB9DKH6_ARCLA|nr:hypothetical protein L6452_09488 [Arctium lappa]
MLSGKKFVPENKELEIDANLKENENLASASTIEKRKQLLFDIPMEVSRDEVDNNASRIITFADFTAPSYNLGISAPKMQFDPRKDSSHHEDRGKDIEKRIRKRLWENYGRHMCNGP